MAAAFHVALLRNIVTPTTDNDADGDHVTIVLLNATPLGENEAAGDHVAELCTFEKPFAEKEATGFHVDTDVPDPAGLKLMASYDPVPVEELLALSVMVVAFVCVILCCVTAGLRVAEVVVLYRKLVNVCAIGELVIVAVLLADDDSTIVPR